MDTVWIVEPLGQAISEYSHNAKLGQGPFKYYVIKEVGGWGQKMAIFDDLKYCKLSKEVGGPKKVKNIPFGGTRFAFIRCL